jgi:uncharacterized Zn-finger protein
MAIIGASCAKEENMSHSVTKHSVTNEPLTNRPATNLPATNQSVAQPIEVLQVNEAVVTCDGGGGRLGHPKVYLHMQGPLGTVARRVVCPYCSRLFLLTGDPVSEGH